MITPDSKEEAILEMQCFDAINNDSTIPSHAKQLIAKLWRELVDREAWYQPPGSYNSNIPLPPGKQTF